MAPATSVFVGGGTPSLVPADGLAAVLRAIPLAPDAEVTVECNPDDVTEALFETYVGAGVTRVSIGVQSMVPARARRARPHPRPGQRPPGGRRRPGGRAADVQPRRDLRRRRRDARRLAHDARAASSSSTRRTSRRTRSRSRPARRSPAIRPAIRTTTSRPTSTSSPTSCSPPPVWRNYEVSNWARPGHECRHNLLYWAQHDYLGFGCAAHSHRAGRRWWNVRTPERYIDAVRRGPPDRGGGRDPRRRHPAHRRPAARPADHRRGARRGARRRRRCPGWSSAPATAGRSPGGVGCWPTRCRCGCADW